MVQARELNIVNIVEYNGEYKQVGVLFNNSNNTRWNPILVDEKLLLNIGAKFSKMKKGYECDIEGECFEFGENLGLVFTGGEGIAYSQEIIHFHRLQNFLFELKNIELKLQP